MIDAPETMRALRAKAREHQRDVELTLSYLTVSDLASRWHVSPGTIRSIPRDDLPFKEFGRGPKLRRRRYHPEDVVAYERKDRWGGERARS